jgi:tripartite-type tricarboxylate transporter receptor subunit TctC
MREESAVQFAKIARNALVMLMLALSAAPANAQNYPTKTVTIVVPFAAGGAGDILGRMIGPYMEKRLGKPFIVENRVGAGGVVGATAFRKAAPDGHSIMIAPSPTMAVNVTLYKKLPYDPVNDFIPLAMAAGTPFVLVVNPSLPVKTVADLIAYVKARPGKLSYGTAGAGVPHHLFMELLKSKTGMDMSPVAYKGGAPAIADVVAGHIPLMFVDLGPALGLIRAGKVRALGTSVASGLEVLPGVPPVNKTVPDFDVASWQMVVAPAKTPRPTVDKLHTELKAVFAQPQISGAIAKTGMLPLPTPTVEAMQAFVKSEIARWGEVVRKAGIAGSR